MTTTESPAIEAYPTIARRHLNRSLVGLLLIQMLVGVANAIWLVVPASGNAWAKSAPMILLYAHVLVSALLVVMAIGLLIVSARTKSRAWITSSLVGVVGIVISVGAGFGFIGSNGNDIASFTMALGCILALAAYTVGLVRRGADR